VPQRRPPKAQLLLDKEAKRKKSRSSKSSSPAPLLDNPQLGSPSSLEQPSPSSSSPQLDNPSSSSLPQWRPQSREQDLADVARLSQGLRNKDPKAAAEVMLRRQVGAPVPPSPNISLEPNSSPQSESTTSESSEM
jgi:hypothetical protein